MKYLLTFFLSSPSSSELLEVDLQRGRNLGARLHDKSDIIVGSDEDLVAIFSKAPNKYLRRIKLALGSWFKSLNIENLVIFLRKLFIQKKHSILNSIDTIQSKY